MFDYRFPTGPVIRSKVTGQHRVLVRVLRERYDCLIPPHPLFDHRHRSHAESDVRHTVTPTPHSFLLAMPIAHDWLILPAITSDRRSGRRHSPDPFPMSSHRHANSAHHESNFYIREPEESCALLPTGITHSMPLTMAYPL